MAVAAKSPLQVRNTFLQILKLRVLDPFLIRASRAILAPERSDNEARRNAAVAVSGWRDVGEPTGRGST